jgi:hypothetical protein
MSNGRLLKKREHLKKTQTKSVVNHRFGRNYCVNAGCSNSHKKELAK